MSIYRYATPEYIDQQEAQLSSTEIEKVKALAAALASVMGVSNREAYAGILSLIPPHRAETTLVDAVNVMYQAAVKAGKVHAKALA